MKIIHTSDWHLGAKLHERDMGDDHRRFLDFLRALAADERPDALIVAGDIFDTRQPPPSAQRLYYDFLADVAREGVCPAVVAIAGNHDSAQLLSAADRALGRLGVHVVARADAPAPSQVVALRGGDGACSLAIAAVPFANIARACGAEECGNMPLQRRISSGFRLHCRAVLDAAKAAARGAPVVAVAHCTLAGARLSDARSERGRQTGGLDARDAAAFAGADYVALGHLHVPQCVGGDGCVRYSGSPLAMSFAEAGQRKSVCIVEAGARSGGAVAVREVAVPEFTPLRVVAGSQRGILDELAALASSAASPVLVALKVTEGEGEMSAFAAAARAVAQGGKVEILPIEDARERETGGADAMRQAATLDELSPLDVAMLRLEEERLAPEEAAAYRAMLEEVVGEVRLQTS